eukprot:Opistho-1_new@99583
MRLGRRERLVQRPGAVGVQVVGHQDQLGRGRVHHVEQVPDEPGEVHGRPPLRHLDGPPPGQRLERHEQVGGPGPLVLAVLLRRAPGSDREGLADVPDELLPALVHAHHRAVGVVGPVVHVDHVLHRRDEPPGRLRRDDPLLLEPRLEVVFWSVRQTVDGSIPSTTSSSTSFSARSTIVHRAYPSGASEQARATSWASCRPSSLRYWRPVGFFRWRVASSPSAANCCRTRWTVIRDVPRWSAMSSSVHPSGPSASASRRMSARRRIAAGWVPVRSSRVSAARGSSVSRITTLCLGAIADPP